MEEDKSIPMWKRTYKYEKIIAMMYHMRTKENMIMFIHLLIINMVKKKL